MALHHRRRWIVPCQWIDPERRQHPMVLWSDDDGYQWHTSILPAGPTHEPVWPHKGVRWQNHGCEPTVVELSTGRLWMIFRTSTDTHYESFSDDGDETWTTPGPSRFYGTITMPTLFRLSDGRILFFWCNTTPLPELDHDQQPELDKWERDGWGEDFFTNRDAFHAAISEDDGKTWKGFREVRLSPIRNNADCRSLGGNEATLDKSMHQSQAVELPTGHVLVSHGQHPMCRRIVIFHPDWLYEQERSEDFRYGLSNVSSFQYVKSIAGNFRSRSGHCCYNRIPGPLLLPSPDGERREADPRRPGADAPTERAEHPWLELSAHPDPGAREGQSRRVCSQLPCMRKSGCEVDVRRICPSASHRAQVFLAPGCTGVDNAAHER